MKTRGNRRLKTLRRYMNEYSNFPIRPWTGSPPMSSSLLFSPMCNKCLTNMQYPYVYAEAIARKRHRKRNTNTYTGYNLESKAATCEEAGYTAQVSDYTFDGCTSLKRIYVPVTCNISPSALPQGVQIIRVEY